MEENKVNEANKIEDSEEAQQVTTIEKKTKIKNPGRVAAGKKLAERNKKVREAEQTLRKTDESKANTDESKIEENKTTSPLSINQMISKAGIAVSIAGLYYKRKEIMSFMNNTQEKKDSEETSESETKNKYAVKSMD